MAGSNRYGWPDAIGTGGRITPEYAKNSAATIESLERRRIEQEQQISSLRAKHTQSIIDGEEFDAGPIRVAEDELTAIITAQRTLVELQKEHERREAEALEKLSDKEKRKRIADQIRKMERDWLDQVKAVEDAARKMAAAYGRAEDARKTLHVALMSQGTSSIGLMSNGFEIRVGTGLSAILAKQIGKGNLGQIKLPASTRDVNLPWVDVELPVCRDVEQTIKRLLSNEMETA
ncbi:hypothetical protein SAMN04488523_105323 [Sulfitobacter brevis]|uniref:Uncharacterized protein n=1 Tax=Sulfitobacter brevis TaxID=74348 RepID=A0A1I1YNY3_9RHOB|nr:hypothetical protein [Sulfitobacter brevis]SFE21022.1 hypothetical protein SAMN04488523_105323 [Sulfitobacter brevis]